MRDRIIPITDLQQHTRKYVQQVRDTGQPIYITQHGRATAVLLSSDDFEGHLATLDEMSYPDWRQRLDRATQELDEGKNVPLKTYARRRAKRNRG